MESVEPLDIALEKMAGSYHNVGYKGLVLEMKDGKLVADYSDRCFPYMLAFEHLTGNKFTVEMHGVWQGKLYDTIQGEIRTEGGQVTAIGVGLEKDVKGGLIWFDRV